MGDFVHQSMDQNRAARMGGTLCAAFGMRREKVSDPIYPVVQFATTTTPNEN